MNDNNRPNDELKDIVKSFEKRTNQISEEQREARERFVVALSELSRQYDLLREWTEKSNVELKNFLENLSGEGKDAELSSTAKTILGEIEKLPEKIINPLESIEKQLKEFSLKPNEPKQDTQLLEVINSINQNIEKTGLQYTDVLKSAKVELQGTLEKLGEKKELGDILSRMDVISEKVEQIPLEVAKTSKSTEAIDNSIRHLIEQIVELSQTLGGIKTSIVSLSSNFREATEDVSNVINNFLQVLTKSDNEISANVISTIDSVGSQLLETMQSIKNEFSVIIQRVEKTFSDALFRQSSILEKVNSSFSMIADSNSNIQSKLNEITVALDTLNKKQDVVSAVVDRRGEGIEQTIISFHDSIKTFADISNKNTNEIQKAIFSLPEIFKNQLTSLEKTIVESDSNRKNESQKLLEKLSLIPDEMGKYYESNKKLFGAVETSQVSMSNISTNIENLMKNLIEGEKNRKKQNLLDMAQNHLSRGVILFYRGSLGAAEMEIRKAIELRDNYAEAYLNLGMVLGESGKTEKAIENIKKALEIEPGLQEAYNNLGVIQLKGEMYEEALESFNESIKSGFNYPQLYINMAKALIGLDRIDEAVTALEKAVEIDPTNADAKELLSTYKKDID